MRRLTTPVGDRAALQAWVAGELGSLFVQPFAASDIVGGQRAADAALAAFDVTGYARRRNEVWPRARRGASGLSPYIRHGLITLRRAWDHVTGGPDEDVTRFRDELMWQEYARHLYARVGPALGRSLRFAVEEFGDGPLPQPWAGRARCLDESWGELVDRGWITNQQRMWLASHWSVRHGLGWRDGEDVFFRHLLDGSRAANRLGWQWTVGALTGKPYGFSRWQVEKRATGLCARCPLQHECPIEDWPADRQGEPRGVVDPRVRRDPDVQRTAGPLSASASGPAEAVWITAESLGDDDPAMRAHPDLPVIFVFDEPLLRGLRLSAQRLVFLAECLADLAQGRELQAWLGSPTEVLAGIPLAATFAPVPGWRRRAASLALADVRPWPWLVAPRSGPVTSFTAWARQPRR